ncbi:NAD(P)/FAD-dependent oxidoreductase [Nocardioides sp. CFH 31398]|uniref:NAD(P)/FAD-dependent oxidoreductase n=1 Tax=Nocardioides sp. CFH 31398 TaxID=2919579 RepID=UPI001F058207|nr:NAD(P)/FAD-dependent oxidoreductase [Nocardioides sp. CFH 31398]MCH1865767.1 NAD(P)/FAD-dependent oxidoreductase [Nocardioides sp. CFH 31398]
MHRDFDYVIVGGGMVADSAARGIRERDETGSIAILGEEPTAPFPRPALSKKLWTDPDFTVENTALGTGEDTGATVVLDTRVTAVDTDAKQVTAGDDTIGYGRLLLATGGRPTRIDGLEPGDKVVYFRTLSDYLHLRELADDKPHVAVVGGGYIGTEIAAALISEGCRVELVHPDSVLNETKFPADLASDFEGLFTSAGVELRPGTSVVGGSAGLDGVTLALDDGSTLNVDVAVVGLGIEPATELAEAAGLEVGDDGGIVVDERLATSAPDVFAAGDVASYPDRVLGRSRIEHVDNATTMGQTVGRVMAGSDETYDHTPYFYSAVLGTRYEAVGTLDSSLETEVSDGPEDGARTIRYRDGDTVAGVLLWNVSGDDENARDAAREAIRTSQPA